MVLIVDFRVCVEVSLPPNILVQMDMIGYRKSGALPRHCMHVQGLSHWAPANIGPYSQATKVDYMILLGTLNRTRVKSLIEARRHPTENLTCNWGKL